MKRKIEDLSHDQLMEYPRRNLVAFVGRAPEVRESGRGLDREELVEMVEMIRDKRRMSAGRRDRISAEEANAFLAGLPAMEPG